MVDITIDKKTVKRQCVYLIDGYGNQFNILFSESKYASSCVDIINNITRSFSKMYFGITYCYNELCPCSPFYSLNWIRKEKGFEDTMSFIEKDNKELFVYLNKVFDFFDENKKA